VRTVNVGVIGAGFMGKAHSLAYAAMPMFFWPAPAVPGGGGGAGSEETGATATSARPATGGP
jgi:predicted dehydrogenase